MPYMIWSGPPSPKSVSPKRSVSQVMKASASSVKPRRRSA